VSFLNPWAWLGAALVAVPVLVHMLARSRAPRQDFPTLRFFREARIVAVRRSRITDLPLLLLRCAVVLAAVAALAQPYLRMGERQARLAQSVARIVVVDSSASMQRLTAEGETALSAARSAAAELADARATLVESAAPGAVLQAAGDLLSRRSGVREVVVVSDFQAGTLHDADIATLPPGTGLRLHRVSAVATESASNPRGRRDAGGPASPGVTLLTAPADAARGAAIVTAALNGMQSPGERRIVLMLPGYGGAAGVLRDAQAPGAPWMARAVTGMRRDDVLAAAARQATAAAAARQTAAGVAVAAVGDDRLIPVARAADGTPLIRAGAWDDAGGTALLLVAELGAGELVAAAAVAAAARALAETVPVRERNTAVIPDEVLRGWERDAVASTSVAGGTDADGRWLWLLVLLLLGAEALLRRRLTRREPAHA
jgi:hypothetical protein